MNKKEQEKKYLQWYAIIGGMLGFCVLLAGILMMIGGVEIFGLNFPNNDSAPWGFSMIGALILIITIAPFADSQTKTKKQKIEEKDERNIEIRNLSSFYSYGFLMGFGVLALLFLTMLGYMNTVSFFTLAGIFIFSSGIQYISTLYLKRRM